MSCIDQLNWGGKWTGHLLSDNHQPCTKFGYTMRKNLPKTFSVLKFRINLLNFSLKNISQNV